MADNTKKTGKEKTVSPQAEALKKAWEKLTPDQKRKVVWMAAVALVILFALGAYYMKTKGAGVSARKTADPAKKEVAIDRNLLEKNAYLEGKKELSKIRDEVRQEMQDLKKGGQVGKDGKPVDPSKPGVAGQQTQQMQQQPGGDAKTGVQLYTQAPPAGTLQQLPQGTPGSPGGMPAIPQLPPPPSATAARERAPEPEREESIGGIESTSNNYKGTGPGGKDDVKKKRSVFLPPSFMSATLLSGLDAPASSAAKSHPMPALLRIKDMAFLPNNIKRNLKGCFVIAEGSGNLADERAHLRLVTLSCLSKKGKSIINSPIKGFVVDESGKIGIRGVVVSKMGSVIARSLIAGFVAGFGDAFKQSTVTTSLSALGATQVIDSDKLAKAGLGQGISQAAQEIQKFYLDLARQTVPVIEIGATRELTLVVSDGVELDIKEIGGDGLAWR